MTKHSSSSEGVTSVLVLSIFGAVMGSFQFGWNTGVINNPQPVIKAFINSTLIARSSSSDTDTIMAIIVSAFALSGMFGGLLAGWFSERFGRSRSILYVNGFCILAGLFFGLSKVGKSFEMIIVGRLLVGFGSGLYTGLVPLYLSEISPVALRGSVGIVNQAVVVSAIFLSQIMGLTQLMSTEQLWPVLLALTALPSIIQVFAMPFCPESPRYLLIIKGDDESARQALIRLRGTMDVGEEMEQIQNEASMARMEAKVSVLGIFMTPHLRRAITIGIILHLSQQLCGVNNIFYYSSTLFTATGLSKDASEYATLGVGGGLIIMTIVSIPFMERAGRRFLQLTGLAGILVCSIIFTITFSLQDKVSWFSYISITAALVFVLFFAIGPGGIPWMMMAELFSQGPRSSAVAIGVAVNWSANFAVGLCFPFLLAGLNTFIFVPFSVITLLCLVYLYFFMIETKGRTTQEVTEILIGNGRAPINTTQSSDTLNAPLDPNNQITNNYGSSVK